VYSPQKYIVFYFMCKFSCFAKINGFYSRLDFVINNKLVKVKTLGQTSSLLATLLKQSFEAPLVKSLVSAKKLLTYNFEICCYQILYNFGCFATI